ncbi:hypothetical protein ACFQV4_20970 [Streptomyces thermocarboxydus]
MLAIASLPPVSSSRPSPRRTRSPRPRPRHARRREHAQLLDRMVAENNTLELDVDRYGKA